MWRIEVGDAAAVLATLPGESVQACVTSPPYWGLRDYGVGGQIGLEPTPDEYVTNLVQVFREVRRVLRSDGTLWLNLGDCYSAGGRGGGMDGDGGDKQRSNQGSLLGPKKAPPGLKPKDLVGIPWRVAFALQADGWWLRSDIVWAKPNPMPESVTDRPTRSHEYLFLLAKSERYYYDAKAIAEPVTDTTTARVAQASLALQNGSTRQPGKTNGPMKAVPGGYKHEGAVRVGREAIANHNRIWGDADAMARMTLRNARSVWNIATTGYREAHFATFPPELPRRCILAGSRHGDTVIDPFAGAGTTILVADQLQRHAIGIELNHAYADLARRRIRADAPLLAGEPA